MEKLIKNIWCRESGKPFAIARILNHKIHPEGLDTDRIRFFENGKITPDSGVGHIISVHQGGGVLHVKDDNRGPFRLEAGVHVYIPPGLESVLDAEAGTELVKVSSASAAHARGKQLLLRDEIFIAACASDSQSLRWAFTPQYLSRRIFLHHDQVLLSKSGFPVSWYRTTMFDVAGLPKNQDGEPVFKMSYNSRTECNVCYDVAGTARVRMSRHPYKLEQQSWGPWLPLDGDSTYHLNEAAGSPEEERYFDEITQTQKFFRNKHEVYIADGHVSLFCVFDPAPTGVENHHPGEYSDYEPLDKVLGSKSYEIHQREIAKFDEMVDGLSMARAMGTLHTLYGTQLWDLYQSGREVQVGIEAELARTLADEGNGREKVLARWMQQGKVN